MANPQSAIYRPVVGKVLGPGTENINFQPVFPSPLMSLTGNGIINRRDLRLFAPQYYVSNAPQPAILNNMPGGQIALQPLVNNNLQTIG